MKHKLKGDGNRNVWLNEKFLSPKRSQEIMNHSPDGFSWGYHGSGPAQLALAIVLELTGKPEGYQEFKCRIISRIRGDFFEIEFDYPFK